MYLLLDTTGRLVALSRITPTIPIAEAAGIWKALSSHMEHEGTPASLGSSARDFFINVLVSSPSNVGERAKVANLLRLYVTDTFKEPTLRAHIMGVPKKEPMP